MSVLHALNCKRKTTREKLEKLGPDENYPNDGDAEQQPRELRLAALRALTAFTNN
jgi:hypothetical protein